MAPGPDPKSSAAQADAVPYSGKIVTARMNVGVGIQVHAPMANNFLNLFAEMKYGTSLSTHSTTEALLNTKSTGQTAVEFGMSMGIARTKAFGFYKIKRRRH